MWTHSENSELTKPSVKEISGNNVILRKNFQRVEAAEETPAHWGYEEWQMTAQQYEIYQAFEAQISEQSDALVELAELVSEVL